MEINRTSKEGSITHKVFNFSVLCYVFTLPFLILGIKISEHYLSFPDLFLLSAVISLIVLRPSLLEKTLRSFLLIYLLFLLLLLPSFFSAEKLFLSLVDIAAYIHALIAITVLFVFFNINDSSLSLKKIMEIYFLSILISSIPGIFSLFSLVIGGEIPSFMLFLFSNKIVYKYLLVTSNHFGIWLIVGLLIAIISYTISKEKNTRTRFLPLVIISIPSLLLSGSRTSMFLLLLILLFYFIFILPKEISKRTYYFFLFGSAILFLSFFFLKNHHHSINRFFIVFERLSSLHDYRFEQLDNVSRIFPEINLFKGLGLGNYELYDRINIELHNSILIFFVETGIIGLFGFLFLLFSILRTVFKIKEDTALFHVLIFCFLMFLFLLQIHHAFRERWIAILLAVLVFFANHRNLKNKIS